MAFPCAGGCGGSEVARGGALCKACRKRYQAEGQKEAGPSSVPRGPEPSMLYLIRKTKRLLKFQLLRLEKHMHPRTPSGARIPQEFNPLYTEQLKELSKSISDMERSERQYRVWAEEEAEKLSDEAREDGVLDWLDGREEPQALSFIQAATQRLNRRRGAA